MFRLLIDQFCHCCVNTFFLAWKMEEQAGDWVSTVGYRLQLWITAQRHVSQTSLSIFPLLLFYEYSLHVLSFINSILRTYGWTTLKMWCGYKLVSIVAVQLLSLLKMLETFLQKNTDKGREILNPLGIENFAHLVTAWRWHIKLGSCVTHVTHATVPGCLWLQLMQVTFSIAAALSVVFGMQPSIRIWTHTSDLQQILGQLWH